MRKSVDIKGMLICMVLLLCFSGGYGQGITINVKDYGAKGDGKSNDYPAIKKAVAAINDRKGGVLYFPQGNYYLDVYHAGVSPSPRRTPGTRVTAARTARGDTVPPPAPASAGVTTAGGERAKRTVLAVTDLEFINCDGLRIYGEKAVISVKGNIHRKVTRRNKNHTFSSITAITPIKLTNCRNVTVEGLELDGNVDQMSRDKKVNESGGHLIFINKSENVKLNNLKIHHAQTDGIYIRNFSKNVQGTNVVSSNNGRQGMSIIQLDKGVFNNCQFINTGITGGKYGRHAPSAGVDIEPNRQSQRVVNIQFNNCRFENNRGPQFIVSHPGTTRFIQLKSCKIVAGTGSNRLGVLVNAREVSFEDCVFELGKANIYPARKPGSSSTFKNCVIRSSSSGFVAVNTGTTRSVVIDGCTLEYTGKEKIKSYFPYINMQEMVFINNTIKVPSKYNKTTGTSGMIQNSRKVSGNKYQNNGKEVKKQLSVKGSRVAN